LDSVVVTELTANDESIRLQLIAFRELMQRWQSAVVLPIDQLVLTLAQDLYTTTPDLAIAHSLALYLGHQADNSPHGRLPEFTIELKLVAQNKRRVIDLSEEGNNYNPDDHKGKVTVATMHSAKGLEWDRVYLMSVNNYDFPSAEPQDKFIGETWYLRDKLNLQAEALEQLKILQQVKDGELVFDYEEGKASDEARIEYAAERLRLLYVGITRARSELVMTWNTGRDGTVLQATPFVALQTFWEKERAKKK
jgi:DNA helicase-2/ATP-dependent DNA helicase PcrA